MARSTTIIAIDPGQNGGIAVSIGDTIECYKMPDTPKDILDLLSEYSPVMQCPSKCYMEKVNGMPGQGGVAMFSFGKGYGWIEMALLSLEIPTETLSPQKWQKEMNIGTKSQCANSTEWKNKLKAKAQQLFPHIKVTLWSADALLILHYAMTQKS